MRVDELMRQKRYVDSMIDEIVREYQYGGGYRIEWEIEHDTAGVCGLRVGSDKEKNQMGAVKKMRMLFFLLSEKKCIAEAVSKCQKENNKEIVKIFGQGDDFELLDTYKEYMGRISSLYAKLPSQKKIQKTKSGYDKIVTWNNKIDRTLLDVLYRKYSQAYQTLQTQKEEFSKMEIDYEPAINYAQYEELGLDACLRELEEKGVITDGK